MIPVGQTCTTHLLDCIDVVFEEKKQTKLNYYFSLLNGYIIDIDGAE